MKKKLPIKKLLIVGITGILGTAIWLPFSKYVDTIPLNLENYVNLIVLVIFAIHSIFVFYFIELTFLLVGFGIVCAIVAILKTISDAVDEILIPTQKNLKIGGKF